MNSFETINMADVPTKSVDFLWESFIPFGTVSLVSGLGGLGKSFLTLAIAAAVTRGIPLPGENIALPPSDVIIQNAENPLPTVVKPRLEMLGADCARVRVIDDSNKPLTLTDERIEAAIIRHNVKYAVIDPVQSFLGNISMNRAESVRPAITHLEKVAERTNSAIVLVGHLSKSRAMAQHRVLGSVDLINAVPSAMFIGKAEGYDDDIRILAHSKSNFSELSESRMFRLSKQNGFEWLGTCDATADDVTAHVRTKGSSLAEDTADFLRDLLSDGALPAKEVEEIAFDSGISEKTLYRAKKLAGVKSTRVDGHWMWSLE